MLFWRWRDLRLHSHAAIGFAALALVVVDASVAGVRGGDRPPTSVRPSATGFHQPKLYVGHGLQAEAIASGGGRIWVLARRLAAGGDRLEEIDPRTEQTVSSTPVPRSAEHVFYGADRVWLTGRTRITVLDPRTKHVDTIQLSGGTLRSMAFAGSTAYAAVVSRDEVLEIKPGKQLRTKVIEEKGAPLTVVAVPRAIEVANNEMNLVPVILPGADTSFLATLQLGRPVIAAGDGRVVWVRRGHLLVRETLHRGAARPARQYVDVHGIPLQVMMASDGGCYVMVRAAGRSQPSLLYFSRHSLRAANPKPSAVHRGRQVRDFAIDPAGGVAYVDAAGHLARWVPGAKALR